MHELSIAENLVAIINDEATKYNATSVIKVSLHIGQLSGVVPDALRFAFEVCTKGTIAENATLEIKEIPTVGHCHGCSKEFKMHDPVVLCPYCRSTDVELVAGRDLKIESMEIEDGSESSAKLA